MNRLPADRTDDAGWWRLPSDLRLGWAFWDDEFVVFHPGTAQAHVLDVYAAEVMDRIESNPTSTHEVAAAIAGLANKPLDAEILSAASQTLRALEAQGLIRRANGPAEIAARAPTEIGPESSANASDQGETRRDPPPRSATTDLGWRERLRGAGAVLRIGPASFRLRGKDAGLAAHLDRHYRDAFLPDDDEVVDAEVSVVAAGGLGRLRQVLVDGRAPSAAVPPHLVPPFVEWAMNWALATRLHQFLLIHAAVVERDGSAVALVGPPGTGKSTLCAALVSARGWRLFSDEFLILDPRTGAAHPLPRPIALKDESIAVLSALAPSAMTGSFYAGTPKGVLAYLSAPKDSLSRQTEAVPPRVVVFPRFQRGAVVTASSVPRARAFLRLADNAFNFAVLGRAGFEELARIVEPCVCWDLVFGDVEEAAAFVERAATDAAMSRQSAAPR